MDLHEKIAREVAKAHGDEYDWFSDTAWFDEAADAILAIPEIRDALDTQKRLNRPNDPNSVQGVDHWSGH